MKDSLLAIVEEKEEVDGYLGSFFEDKDEESFKRAMCLEDEIDDLKRQLALYERAFRVYSTLEKMELETDAEIGKALFLEAEKAFKKNNKDQKACESLEKAAELGYVPAKISYAKSLIYNTHGVHSPEEGLELLRHLASCDIAEAAYLIALIHEDYPDLVDGKEAYECHVAAAKLGYAAAVKTLPKQPDMRSYTEILLSRAKSGDKGAYYLLSDREDLSEDERSYYLERALESKDPSAEADYANACLQQGDLAMAKRYFEQSGKHGNASAYIKRATLAKAKPSFDALNVGARPTRAQEEEFHFIKLAAKLGHVESIARVGDAYLRGIVVEKDEKKGIALLKKSRQNGGRYFSSFALGRYYEMKEDGKKTVKYYKEAAEAGNVNAMKALIAIYEQGLCGIAKSPVLAARYRWFSGEGRD